MTLEETKAGRADPDFFRQHPAQNLLSPPPLSCHTLPHPGPLHQRDTSWEKSTPTLFLGGFTPSGHWALMPEPLFLNLSNASPRHGSSKMLQRTLDRGCPVSSQTPGTGHLGCWPSKRVSVKPLGWPCSLVKEEKA